MDEKILNYPGPASQFGETAFRVVMFLRHVAGLKSRHLFLDVGAGPLRIGRRLIRFLATNCYHAIEPNEYMLYAGASSLPRDLLLSKGVQFSTCNDFRLNSFGHKFDMVLAFNVFIHCGSKQFRTFLANLEGVLKPEGIAVVSLFLAEKDMEQPYGPNYYPHASHSLVYYCYETAKRMISDARLEVYKVIRWTYGAKLEIESSCQFLLRKARPKALAAS